MKRRLLIGIAALLAVCGALAGVATSGANFTTASSSTVSVSTGTVQSLLHLYSQSSDPDGLGSYYTQPTSGALAATGTDATLAVNLGKQTNSNTSENRVFTVKAPATLPTGITTLTLTASVTSDPTTGLQPINSYGFNALGGTGRTTSMTLTAGQKLQVNVRTNVARPIGTVYHPTLVITVTYSGFTGTFLKYTVPFTVTSG
jgi:hypothetical protein